MSLLEKIYKTYNFDNLKLENLEIELKRDLNSCDLHLYFFLTDCYRHEQVTISEALNPKRYPRAKPEQKYSVIYSTLTCYNSFDTFLIYNRKIRKYKKYFRIEPLNTFKKEIERIKDGGDLERNGYVRSIILNTLDKTLFPKAKDLSNDEIINTVDFFIEIFQDKLKNPIDFDWHIFAALNQQKYNQIIKYIK